MAERTTYFTLHQLGIDKFADLIQRTPQDLLDLMDEKDLTMHMTEAFALGAMLAALHQMEQNTRRTSRQVFAATCVGAAAAVTAVVVSVVTLVAT